MWRLKSILRAIVFPLGILYMLPVPDGVSVSPYPEFPTHSWTGALTPNQDLKTMSSVHLVNYDFGGDVPVLKGMESFASKGNYLYTGVHGGDVVKIDPETMTVEKVTKIGRKCSGQHEEAICGRPLGLEFDNQGHLIIADASYGLFKFNEKDQKLTTLVPAHYEIDGKPNKLTNSLAIDKKGIIYYTVSSTNFHLPKGMLEIMSSPSGRLLRYDPSTNTSQILIDDIGFANGVALSPKEDYLLVAETSFARVWKYHLTGPKKGRKEIFGNYPGHTDNIKPNGKGGYFLGIISPFSPDKTHVTQFTGPKLWLRKIIVSFMGILEKALKLVPNENFDKINYWIANTEVATQLSTPYGLLLEVNDKGDIIKSWHSSDGFVALICEGYVHGGYVYLGSPYNNYLARMPYV